MSDVTQILSKIARGDSTAAEQLLPLVYDELRQLAARKVARENPGQTLQATALVHEAYLRLVAAESRHWDNRGHFFAAAAEAMRRILVERARQKARIKHGGDQQRVDLNECTLATPTLPEELLAVHEALDSLEDKHPVKAELVKLRYFVGLSNAEAAKLLDISTSTADRYWTYARAWLFRELKRDGR